MATAARRRTHSLVSRIRAALVTAGARLRRAVSRPSCRRAAESGMTTAEYAIGTVAACTFAALLIAIVRSPEIKATLMGVITGALGLGG